jgi:ribosomal protein L3 glutamine methyltransferase
VDAVDISQPALELAARNAARHGVGERLRLIRSDLFGAVPRQPYDLILANPPYVPATEVSGLPGEYRAEPGLGLASGADGLDATLEILARAADYLGDGGVLICEVGESEQRLADCLPDLPFLWLEFAHGGSGVFLLERAQLESVRGTVDAVIRERKNVA